MIKSKTIETVEEFDKDGRLLRRTITETEETDDNPTRYTHTSTPAVLCPSRTQATAGCGPVGGAAGGPGEQEE